MMLSEVKVDSWRRRDAWWRCKNLACSSIRSNSLSLSSYLVSIMSEVMNKGTRAVKPELKKRSPRMRNKQILVSCTILMGKFLLIQTGQRTFRNAKGTPNRHTSLGSTFTILLRKMHDNIRKISGVKENRSFVLKYNSSPSVLISRKESKTVKWKGGKKKAFSLLDQSRMKIDGTCSMIGTDTHNSLAGYPEDTRPYGRI
jgi:hypothetical protein